MSIATIHGLTKQYPSFKLENISFTLNEKTITGFIGRNGAGKTTTIKSMLNLVHPDSGTINYFGMDLIGHEALVKSRIGYSTGTVNWYPRKKIKDIVSIEKLFYETWDEEAYSRYLRLFALDETKTPSQLSEGMKVKVNLLLALSHKAELLILDEPTSGLDPFSRDELLDIFTELKESGKSIFFSTHIISDIEKCADDLIYISGGRIVAGMPKNIFMSVNARPGEDLEQVFLRMEKEERHA